MSSPTTIEVPSSGSSSPTLPPETTSIDSSDIRYRIIETLIFTIGLGLLTAMCAGGLGGLPLNTSLYIGLGCGITGGVVFYNKEKIIDLFDKLIKHSNISNSHESSTIVIDHTV